MRGSGGRLRQLAGTGSGRFSPPRRLPHRGLRRSRSIRCPGTLYYVWQEVKMGLMYARTKLHLMSAEDGKKGVLETQLAETK